MDTVALAAAAGATTTIGLLSGVLVGPAWPPVLLAEEAAGRPSAAARRDRGRPRTTTADDEDLLRQRRARPPSGPANSHFFPAVADTDEPPKMWRNQRQAPAS